MRYFKVIFCLLMMAVSTQALAQPDLPSDQVEVIKIFEAQLQESEKVPVLPELPSLDTTVQKQNYEVPAKNIEVEYPAPRIRPITFKSGEEIADIYKAYLKLGAGLPKSIYGDGSFHTLKKIGEKEALDIGLNLSHHQADFSSGDVDHQSFGLTEVKGKGTYYFEKGYAVSGNMGYTADRVSYYGYNFDRFFNDPGNITKDDVKQVFGIFDLGAKIFNGVQTAGDLNYSAGFDFYAMGDSYAANETGFDLKLNATKWINGKHSFDLGLRTDFTKFKVSGVEQSLNNYTLAPAFTFHGTAVKVKLGMKLVSNDDEFFPFPDAEVVVNLTGNELAFYTGVTGDLQKNTFRSLTDYNPFLNTELPAGTLKNTKYFHGYAGLKGNLKMFEYMVQVGYKPTNDLPMYVWRHLDSDVRYDFDVVYDDVNIINLRASLKAILLKNLTVTGTLSQNFFDTNKQQRAWHLPALDANIMAVYTTSDNKLVAKAQLNLQNGVVANERSGGSPQFPTIWSNLNGLYDVSIGGEYWFTKRFGAFLEVNNLLNNKRQRWRYYPTYGTNVLLGITARF